MLYTAKSMPVLTYKSGGAASAIGVCSAIGLAPAAVGDGSVLAAAATQCSAPSQAFFYTAAPGYTSETGFCSYAWVTQTGGNAYTASSSSNMYACASAGFGALVACA